MLKDACLFCKIIKKDIPSKIIYEDSETIAFEDLRPKAPVHILIVPKDHIEKISDLTEKDLLLVGRLTLVAKRIAKDKGIESSGYRLVINCNKDAGQEVFHLHVHLMGGRVFAWPPG